MNTNLYDMITNRRSFHTFKPVGKLTAEDLQAVDAAIGSVKPLFPDIRTKIVLVPSAETSGARGGEYCLLFYSERKTHFLSLVILCLSLINLTLAISSLSFFSQYAYS